MPQLAEIWSSLGVLPTVVGSLIVGVLLALLGFFLNRLGKRADDRARVRKEQPSRRNIRAGKKFLMTLATRPRNVLGPDRWSLTYNSSLSAYEVAQAGPDDVHAVRIDFLDTRAAKQSQLSPTVTVRLLPAGLPLTMSLGAPSRVQHYGLAIRWDDSFGVDQLERIRVADAYLD